MDENIKVKCETEVFGESKSSWLNDIDELVTCSRCGFSYPLRELLMLRRTYCRNCGAELDLVKSLPSAQPEVTEEAVKEYCRKRNLCVIDSALLKKYASTQPERKKGHWVGTDDNHVECDACGFTLEDWIQGVFYNFCPNCGLDMRVGETDEAD